jgi:hypothetical protein
MGGDRLHYLPQATAVVRSGIEVLLLTIIALELPVFVAGLTRSQHRRQRA